MKILHLLLESKKDNKYKKKIKAINFFMMVNTINKLELLLKNGLEYFTDCSNLEMSKKPLDGKWSKKEILGHLIDSAINNLQRFTEIQFEEKPYKIRSYNQDQLVKANDYQNANTKQIIELWYSINTRIVSVIKLQTAQTLNYKIELTENSVSDLRFLIEDYEEHLEHHLKPNSLVEHIR